MFDPARQFSGQVTKERQNKTAEFFTPRDLVDRMLDQLPAEAWTDPSKTFLEPSCGDGNFLEAIHERLMTGLTCIADPVERHKHIIEEMLFGIDLMPDNVEACIQRLKATGLKHNIIQGDSLALDLDTCWNREEPLFVW